MFDHTRLKRLLPNFRIVENVSALGAPVPENWKSILNISDQDERKKKVIETWTNCFPNQEMSNTVLAMTEFLKQVELIASDYGTSLLYSFDVKGKIHFREGRNPLEKKIRPDVATIWQALPEPLQKFYSGLHDGWFQAGSEAMGPLPSASITPLSTEEWGILQNIRIDFDLKDVITLFSNGGGGYLCLNTATSPAKSLIWWSSQAPDIDVAFFDVLDEWTTMGLVD